MGTTMQGTTLSVDLHPDSKKTRPQYRARVCVSQVSTSHGPESESRATRPRRLGSHRPRKLNARLGLRRRTTPRLLHSSKQCGTARLRPVQVGTSPVGPRFRRPPTTTVESSRPTRTASPGFGPRSRRQCRGGTVFYWTWMLRSAAAEKQKQNLGQIPTGNFAREVALSYLQFTTVIRF